MKLIILLAALFIQSAKADLFLATHLLLNTLAVNYLPSYETNSYHGPYIQGTYGLRYEKGDAYKTGSQTEGSSESSPGFGAGYQFLRSTSHKLALTYDRIGATYQGENDVEGEDTIDAFGLRFNWGILAFKLGWASHALDDDSDNKHDGGSFTGIGFDIYLGRFSLFMDLTDYYLEDRKTHIAGGDIGFRFSFGDVN